MTDVIRLIQEEVSVNEYGEKETIETFRDIIGLIKSVGQKEFYEGMVHGLNLEYKFEISDYLDYEGEKIAEINNERFNVLRVYRTATNSIELTLERKL